MRRRGDSEVGLASGGLVAACRPREEPHGQGEHRVLEIDAARGGLVLIMLVYHCVFSDVFPALSLVKTAVSFIHTAFLMMAGFLCGWHYLPRAFQQPAVVSRRLVVRGMKLLVIFTLTNAVLYAVGYHHTTRLVDACSSVSGLIDHLLLRVDGDLFTFEILAYIGLFLILAGLAIRFPTHFLTVSLAVIAVYSIFPVSTLRFVSCGFVGVLSSWPFAATRMTSDARPKLMLALIPLLLAIHTAAKLSAEQSSPLGVLGIRYMETVAWLVSFVLLYRVAASQSLAAVLPLLGRYSLLAYIGQMLIIIVLRRLVLPYSEALGMWGTYCTVLVSAIIGTCIGTMLCDRLQKTSSLFARTYRAVFA